MAKDKIEAADTTPGRTLVKNPEAVAIDKISTILENLEPPRRRRVLAWVVDVYGSNSGESRTYLNPVTGELATFYPDGQGGFTNVQSNPADAPRGER